MLLTLFFRNDSQTVFRILTPLGAAQIDAGIADVFLAVRTGANRFIFPEFDFCFAMRA